MFKKQNYVGIAEVHNSGRALFYKNVKNSFAYKNLKNAVNQKIYFSKEYFSLIIIISKIS